MKMVAGPGSWTVLPILGESVRSSQKRPRSQNQRLQSLAAAPLVHRHGGYITAYVTKASATFAELSSLSSTSTTLYKRLWVFALSTFKTRELGQGTTMLQVTTLTRSQTIPYKRNRKLKNYTQLLN